VFVEHLDHGSASPIAGSSARFYRGNNLKIIASD
jgi:hypothetical protein